MKSLDKKLVFLLFMLFMLTSCKTLRKESSIPKWYESPPEDTAKFRYVVGTGGSPNQAKLDALNNLAGKFQTKIKGEEKFNRREYDGKYSEQFIQRIKGKIPEIEFEEFKVVKREKRGNQWYLLIRLDVPAFVASTRKKLETKIRELEDAFQTTDKPLQDMTRMNRNIDDLQIAETYLTVLRLLNQDTEYENRKSIFERYRQRRKKLRGNLEIVIVGESNYSSIRRKIASVLENDGIKTDFHSHIPRSTPFIEISIQKDRGKYGEEDFYVNMDFTLAVHDKTGSIVNRIKIKEEGVSYGFELAHKMAINSLNKSISDLSLANLMGLNNDV